MIARASPALSAFDRLKVGLLVLSTLGLAVALMVVPRSKSAVARAVFNGSHVVLSAALALAALWVLGKICAGWPRLRLYGVAALIAVAVGIGLELFQWFGPGDPSFSDVARDSAGAMAGLTAHAAYGAGRRRRWLHLLGLVLASFALSMPGLQPTGDALWRKIQVARQLPLVAAFEGLGTYGTVRTLDGARLTVIDTPSAWAEAASRRVSEVSFAQGHRYPRLLLDNPFADWSGYATFAFSVYSGAEEPLVLHLRIDDFDATLAFSDRFNTELVVQPGHNTYRIPLQAVRQAPLTRELDLGDLENIVLFLDHPETDGSLLFDRFWLE